MNTTIKYTGILQWHEKVYSKPYISVNDRAQPHHNELVLIHTGNSQFVVVPYSNQDCIAGVVENVFESL